MPVWTVAANIPASVVNVPVTIQVWEDDGSSGDDLGDASPRDGDRNLDISVIRQFNTWVDPKADGTGDGIASPQSCSSGNGEDGWPAQHRGVAESAPGLYFLGLPFLYAFASMLVLGAGRDAEYVVNRIASRRPAETAPLDARSRGERSRVRVP